MSCDEAKDILAALRVDFGNYKKTLDTFVATGDEAGVFGLEYLKREVEQGVRILRRGIELPPDHYRVFVDYAPVPPYEQLNGKDFDEASEYWDGTKYTLENDQSIADLDEIPNVRILFIKQFDKNITSGEVIEWAGQNGYRVASLKEALALIKFNPFLKRNPSWLVSLGSYVVNEEIETVVPVIGEASGRRELNHLWHESLWSPQDSFLLVRK